MVSHAELAAAAVAILAMGAESLHAQRSRRLARLAFGPRQRPAPWAALAPALRVLALPALCWGLVTLLELPPKAHVARDIPDKERRHVLIVLDVSPSMRLRDAGPNADQSRIKRVSLVMDSFLERIPVELYLISVVACYNGAKPVVVDTKDLEVVRNIFGDLPMHQAFPSGKTDLFSGLAEAARIAHPWQPRSTLLLMLSDGDTVPAIGMPKMPDSIADVLIVGVGRPAPGFVHRRPHVAPRRFNFAADRRPAGGHLSRRQPEAHRHATPESVDGHPPHQRFRAAHPARIRTHRLWTGSFGAGAFAGVAASLRHSLETGRPSAENRGKKVE